MLAVEEHMRHTPLRPRRCSQVGPTTQAGFNLPRHLTTLIGPSHVASICRAGQ